ncbi:MAG: amino acid ABC transporter permease [Actinobacteria bacterium]|nr:amino acid ABC transporter permease [Actinomycetota bacterium]
MPEWVQPVVEYMAREGLKETARIAVISVVGSALVGVVLGTLLTIRFWPLRSMIRLYIEVWRGLPIIVTIFLIFFALPSVGIRFSPYLAAAIGLVLWGSAQVAEATRGAVESIPREQHQAASALGFGWVGRHAFVILPQALRRLLPPMVSLLAGVIQNTTLASIIGASEVLATGTQSIERLQLSSGNSHSFAIYAGIMAAFFAISFPLTRLAVYLERRLV